MKQLVQNYKTGKIELIDAPAPMVKPGGVLVKNVNSVVSLGTEKSMMEFAKKNIISKALSRPDLTKKVLDFAKTRGFIEAYRQAISRLDDYIPLGYSSAGIVIEVGKGVDEFVVGDRVACARSGFASHAEIISVPRNLCVKIPKDVQFEHAAFATIGAIALHSFRLADLSLGDYLAIIGVGLLGQIAAQIAAAAGVSVFAIDVVMKKVSMAIDLGAKDGGVTGKEDLIAKSYKFTEGKGFDAVIIFASTESNEPLELAADICRERGRIVVPGLVGLQVPRSVFYDKELSLIVSRSSGPGVYDSSFELKGVDYPYAYVKWTEKMNMKAFLESLANDQINLEPIITLKRSILDAETVYKKLLESSDEQIGVILQYDVHKEKEELIRSISLGRIKKREKREIINVGLIGGGNFARGTLLPCIKRIPYVDLHTIATATGSSSKYVGEKFGFKNCTTDYRTIIENQEIECIMIATRHNVHAKIVIEALMAGKDVFVEKPLALNIEELKNIVDVYQVSDGRLMVGYMRRFSPFSIESKKFIGEIVEPLAINYRVNAGKLPQDSWVYDSKEGGGRIIGEVCHFIDLIHFFSGSLTSHVYAQNISTTEGYYDATDNVIINMKLKNGSLASICYLAGGDESFPRERIEIFGNGSICIIDDFKTLYFSKGGRKSHKKNIFGRDIGYDNEFNNFFKVIKNGGIMPISLEENIAASLCTFSIEESITSKKPSKVDLNSIME